MTRILAVTSGKGGVGKTHLCVNLALHAARKGLRTCLFDADLGLANVSLLLDLQPRYTLGDVVAGTCRLRDAVQTVHGFDVIPGSSGAAGMADLPPEALARLGAEFSLLAQYDLVIIDTAAGVANNVLAFVAAAPESLLVVTPEPTALTDAYAMVKLLLRQGYRGRLQVVVNQAASETQARHTFEKFREVVRVYQGIDLPLLGGVPADLRVVDAVRAQTPVAVFDPAGSAARAFAALAKRLLGNAPADERGDELKGFWVRLTGAELPAPTPAAAPKTEPAAPPDPPPSVADLAERLTRLETGVAAIVEELLRTRERADPVSAPTPVVRTEAPTDSPTAPTEARVQTLAERRGNRRAGEAAAPARFVRGAQRATPIDAMQLRRVVGRMLVKAVPAADAPADDPLRVAVDQIQVEADNDFSLRPGRYTRISLHCEHIGSPDGFIEEIFANCAISGCKVRHLGSHVRYWVTSGRDGCILLDGDDGDRNCVQVYMAAGGNNLVEEGAAEDETAPGLRHLPDADSAPAQLLAKFPHQRVQREDREGDPVEMFRLLRRDREPLLCAFHSSEPAPAVGDLRKPSPERAI